MKILVSGGAGFLGSHIADRLSQDGHDITILDNLSTGKCENVPEGAKFIHNGLQDGFLLRDLLEGVDAVFHFAAIARMQDAIENPRHAHEVNATGTLNLLLAAKKTGVKRFVHASSSILYAPTTPYYVSKRAAEEYASIFPALYGLSTISLRFANVYGSRQSQKGSYPNVLASFAKDKRDKGYITIYGDGSVTRDFVHVSDAVEASVLAMKSDKTGVYDVGTSVYHTIQSVAERFECPIRYEEPRKGDVQHIRLDPAPAYADLGFASKIELKDGIKDYL